MVALYVPTLPLALSLKRLPLIHRYLTGHLSGDHINAFTPESLRFFCERAGFKTIEVSPFYPFPISLFNHVPLAKRLIGKCIYIGEKIENWEYPARATRRAANNIRGFEYVDDMGFSRLRE